MKKWEEGDYDFYKNMIHKKKIAVLGSTGSIGIQTLDIIKENPELFEATVLVARRNWELLEKQARQFQPSDIVVEDYNAYLRLKEALSDTEINIMQGAEEIAGVAESSDADIVVTAMVGYSGLLPTIKAINSGKTIALANKETLVVGGSIIIPLAKKKGVSILPVDSEHSAIFQCLTGERSNELRRIFLTASGGPFRKISREELEKVTVKQALAHPNWDMGPKVTIDSASMMNKGFEMIEAKWLFGCEPSQIEVVVHPQSIVHSMVEFKDGSIKAQLAAPDMHLPIKYALGYPERLSSYDKFLNISDFATLTFEKPDLEKFPLLQFAYNAVEEGGNMPCLLNAANEKGVEAFVSGKIRFTDLPKIAEYVMKNSTFISNPTLDDLIESNREALEVSNQWLNHK